MDYYLSEVFQRVQMVFGLITLAVFMYIGAHLEPSMETTVATITTPTYSSGVVGLNGLIMPALGVGSVLLVLKSMKSAG